MVSFHFFARQIILNCTIPDGGIRYSGTHELTIDITGTNSLTGGETEGNNSYGIYAPSAALTINGSGSLNVTAGDVSGADSYGIYADSIEIESGTVSATGGSAANSYGIYGTESVQIKGGTVTGTGGTAAEDYSYGIYGYASVQISGGTVTGTGGTVTGVDATTTTQSYGIRLGDSYKSMEISGDADVTGNAGDASDSRGISAGILNINTTRNVTGTAENSGSFGTVGIRVIEMNVENGTVSGTGTTSYENKVANGIYSTKITLNGGTITGSVGGNGTRGAINMSGNRKPVSTTGVVEAKAGNDESSAEAVEPDYNNLYSHPWVRLIWTHQHDGVSFTAWDETDSLPETAGDYCLTGNVTLSGRWVVPQETTNLCLNGYNITLSENVDDTVVYIGSGAVLNLYDDDEKTGKITGGSGYVPTSGTTEIKGGGVYIAGGIFNMRGGIITGNHAGYGGGAAVSGGTFNMYGGSITGNTANYNGNGVYVDQNSGFNMYGGTISNNTGGHYGGGVYASIKTTFDMQGGSITGNTASRGGGAYVAQSFNMTGGSIKNNTAVFDGGGVCLFSDAAFKVSGNPTITDNKLGNEANNVYVDGTIKKITFGENGLESDARIGVNMGDNPGVFTSGLSGKGTVSNFVSDDPDYVVSLNSSGEAKLAPYYVAEINGTKYTSLQAAYDAAQTNSTIKLISDIEIPNTENARLLDAKNNKIVTVDLNGHTAIGGGSDLYFVYIGDGKLILQDSIGGGAIRATGGSNYCIRVATGKNLIIKSGEYSSYSNIIQSSKSSNVEISGGTFKTEGNSTIAAMAIGGNAVFSGGTIEVSRNANTFEVFGQLTITGGTVGSYNKDKAAVWLYKNSNVSTYPSAGISGGTINGSLQEQFSTTNGTFAVSGGSFLKAVPDKYCAAGYMPWDKGDGTYSVEEAWTITFNANDESSEPGTKTQKVSKRTGSATLDLNTFTLTDFTFAGWNTQADGKGLSYADGAIIEAVTKDMTLYALWSSPVTVPTLWGANVNLLGATILQIWTQFPENTDVASVKLIINGRKYDTPLADAVIRTTDTLSSDHSRQTYKVFSCPVYAKELNDDVTIQMLNASGSLVRFSYMGKESVDQYWYSVRDYLESDGIRHSTDYYLQQLGTAMEHYADYAQYYFEYREGTESREEQTPDTPDKSLFDNYQLVTSGDSTDIQFAAGNLDMMEVTKVRVYFAGDVSGYTFTYERDGQIIPLDASRKKFGWNYVEIPDIKVSDLDTMWEITATNGTSTYTVKYGAMTYVRSVLFGNNNASRTLKDFMIELYNYNVAAENYIKERIIS